MSVFFNSASERLIRTTGLVASSSNYTAMAWVRINSLPSVLMYKTPFTRTNAGLTAYTGIYTFIDGSNLISLIVNNGGGANAVDSPYGFTVGQWFHIAYGKFGNQHFLFQNGENLGAVVVNIGAVTFANLFAGGDPTAFIESDLDVAYFREWDRLLTDDEVADEMNSTVPISRLSDLITDTPLTADYADDSGNGNDWTPVGSTSFSTSPDFLANSTSANAITIDAIPDFVSVDLNNGVIAFDAWYRYVGAAGETVVGAWAFGDLVSNTPSLTVWSPDGSTDLLNISNTNAPIQFPVVEGQSYYLRIRPNVPRTVDPTNVTLSLVQAPQQMIPRGSIAVNDDSDGFPIALLSSVDGDDYNLLNFVAPFPGGEAGDVLDDGTILVHDNTNDLAVGFDAEYQQIFSLTGYTDPSGLGIIRTCRGTQQFWILRRNGSNDEVRFITNEGVEGTVHVLGSDASVLAAAICVQNDESVLYYAVRSGGNVGKIQEFDLDTDTLIGTFAPAVTNYLISDLLCLSDDSIVAVYSRSATGDVKVLHYESDGTLLHTIEFGTGNLFPSGTVPRLAYSLDDPDTFWIWRHPSATQGVSKFAEVEVATGSEVRSVLSQEYEVGAYQSAPNASPVRFGQSYSCPFWVATQGFTPTPVVEIETDTVPIRRLRQTPTISAQGFRSFHKMLQIDLQTGVGLSTGQGADPKVCLQISRDGGHTWGNVREVNVGRQGEYLARAMFWQNGSGRQVVYRFYTSDPVPWRVTALYIDVEEGTS